MGKAEGLILAATIMNTAAMSLPVSSFPNANSFAIQRKTALSVAPADMQPDEPDLPAPPKPLSPPQQQPHAHCPGGDQDAAGRCAAGAGPGEPAVATAGAGGGRKNLKKHASVVAGVLSTKDYVMTGGLVTCFSTLLMVTLGYTELKLLGQV